MIRRMKIIQMQRLTRERLPRFQFGQTKKIRKKENPKKQKRKNPKKNRKRKNPKKIEKRKIQKKQKKRKKNLFSVILDKICVFCLYIIPDSQQSVKRGSYRRQILSGLLCFFIILGLEPICDEFELRPRTLSFSFYFIYRVFESFSISYFISYLFRI